jgi:hypothetical protein
MTQHDVDQRDGGIGGSARRKAIDAYDGARESVADAGRRASDGIDEAPLIALVGGVAAGALIAALLPRTQAETRALRPIGDRVTRSAKAAVAAAREAGSERLGELGLTREKGGETLRSIFEGATNAAKSSAQAALNNAKTKD